MSDRPSIHDGTAWPQYWHSQGEPWRTAPELAATRQNELRHRRDTITPNIEEGMYPFRDVRLSRADIEWLLHEHGPIDWNDEQQRQRVGLDLRGAILSTKEEQSDLSGLPLSRTRLGLSPHDWARCDNARQQYAAARLVGANLSTTHLEGADLNAAYMQGVNGTNAFLQHATMQAAHLEGAMCYHIHLEAADLNYVYAQGASFGAAHLEGTTLYQSHLEGTDFSYAHLDTALFSESALEGASLHYSHLAGAVLRSAHLEGANLSYSQAAGADFSQAYLAGADLAAAHLEGANLSMAQLQGIHITDSNYQRIVAAKRQYGHIVLQHLPPASLQGVFFDGATQLAGSTIATSTASVAIADVQWGTVNLAVIEDQWQLIHQLGDERQAWISHRVADWKAAVRANRQVALVLRAQGMSELADRFAYRAQLCQRRLLRLQGWPHLASYLGSGFLDRLAGYGFKPTRTLTVYLVVIATYAVLYWLVGRHNLHHLSLLGSLIFSITSFHGRGFFPGGLALDDPLTVVAATQAIVGLIIEVSIIATFTQRFFSK